MRKLRLGMRGGGLSQVKQLGNSRTRAHLMSGRLQSQKTLPSRPPALGRKLVRCPSRFLNDSTILGDESPTSEFLRNLLVWIILPPEHKRGILRLWLHWSEIYLYLNTKLKSECFVTLPELAALHTAVLFLPWTRWAFVASTLFFFF